jgi:hypothetical protein
MRVQLELELEYEGIQTQEDEHPGYFEKVVDRDYVRLPAVGEGVELDPGSEGGGGAGNVKWIMWGGDGTPRLHLEVKLSGSYVTRKRLVQPGWEER